MNQGWIGVDFDGTLAKYDQWVSSTHCGEPVPLMMNRLKRWRDAGNEIRVFTARIHPLDRLIPPEFDFSALRMGLAADMVNPGDMTRWNEAIQACQAIQAWCKKHIGVVLPVTNVKDYGMIELWDDRCVQVVPNTGRSLGKSTRGLR